MKKLLTLSLMFMLGSMMYAADYLYVRQSEGDTQIAVSNVKEITFPSGSVVVSLTDGTSKTYSSSSFVSLRFNGNISVGVEGIEDAVENVVISGDVIKSQQTGISIYSTDGRLVYSTDESEANISSLSNGIYIVKTGCITTKIVK